MVTTKLLRLLLAAGVLVSAAPRAARACGGFFCDRPGVTGDLPIAQSAENVFFFLGTDAAGHRTVEAHIQIVYKGAADQFSWIVPVTTTPTLDVGTDVLFDRLEAATKPTFSLKFNQEGTCAGQGGGGSGCGLPGGGASASNKGGTFGGPGVDDGMKTPPVSVLFQGAVGPYETAIVKSDDPQALRAWLDKYGYYVTDDAARIVNDYVAANSAFVALRLRQGLDTTAIRPIVLKLPAEEACLPLKLTAIASVPDLRINVWVLGDGRAVPITYTEIALNAARVDWFGGARNYDQVLGEAANEAGGNAFAVEYAQPAVMFQPRIALSPAQVQSLRASTTLVSLMTQLQVDGFAARGDVLDVLRQDLPLPKTLADAGVTEADFYASFAMYWPRVLADDPGAEARVDRTKLLADLDQAVFTPLQNVSLLFTPERTLTRLATFISPDEMNKDPVFVTNRDLPMVNPAYQLQGTLLCTSGARDVCHAPMRLTITGGNLGTASQEVVYSVPKDAPSSCNTFAMPTYDRGDLDTMPASTVGYARAADSPGTMALDNQAAIATALTKHNQVARATGEASSDGCAVPGHAHPALSLMAIAVALLMRTRRRRAS